MGSNGKIALPKDAEGREIPLDTKVLYDKSGNKRKVQGLEYSPIDGIWKVTFLNSFADWYEKDVYLTPRDSWEKLLEDLDRAAENNDAFLSMQCAYMNQAGDMCGHCKLHDPIARDCFDQMVEDIASRIRKLRGEDE